MACLSGLGWGLRPPEAVARHVEADSWYAGGEGPARRPPADHVKNLSRDIADNPHNAALKSPAR